MSEAKFTTGEWYSYGYGVGCGGYLVADTKHESTDDIRTANECRANASLIAAAPNMYDEIENDIKELDHELKNQELNPIARSKLQHRRNYKVQLLAKARGEV